jgi:hypothetical protein
MAKKESGKAKAAAKKISFKREVNTGKLIYENWQIYPHIAETRKFKSLGNVIWKRMTTKHEGDVLYYKFWNFWIRAGVDADMRADLFFRDYEAGGSDIDDLLKAVGFTWTTTETEEEVWGRIGKVWTWFRNNVKYNPADYATVSSVAGEWPSIFDYAKYYASHKNLVCGTCFSTAHIFATLLGRIIYPRYRFAIAEAHHTENGAPPTATHVYVAAYVSERWFYLDPTAIFTAFPDYARRQSMGVSGFTTVDYEHPYEIIPLPLSYFDGVPYLPC